ncbi:MAG TPA: PDZ domain-containing protein [Candidatus Cloacimonetes bacterium]|nr:PDZ domain-containing protein [Candidatus Cloacimonadota bacterium]
MKKKSLLLVVVIILGSFLLYSQTTVDSEEIQKEVDEAMKEVQEAMKEVEKETGITVDLNLKGEDYYTKPFMGVYYEDLTMKKARELGYNQFYGILLTGIVKNSPAKYYRLLEEDILMKIDDDKVLDKSKFGKLIDAHYVGDKVKLTIFRDGQQKVIDFMFGARNKIINEKGELVDKPETVKKEEEKIKKKKRLSVGHGGGGWYPIWFMPDFEEFNLMLAELEFQTETFPEKGFLMHGGGGQGNVGKGWFIGGMGAGYSNKETTKHDWTHYVENQEVTKTVSRTAEYKISYGGVTLDKRFALSKKIVGSFGMMLGWGNTQYKIQQYDKNQDLDNFDFGGDLNDQMDNYYDYVSTLKMNNDYMLFQPKFMLMYRILDWLSLRAEAGYMKSYSAKGWKGVWNGESVKVENEPKLDMDGITLVVGPWFGF